ncbi:hypothetical protein CVT26_015061 [Gymnopilus dilepis]|uniref:Hydrophobin n=1 Tax=Gymnopilus dilepis TaxID=231916 RepID=A0A409W431_9AGAR|nr:hypothetical protein CVT26_015061 [Gymnopilus dilepis]
MRPNLAAATTLAYLAIEACLCQALSITQIDRSAKISLNRLSSAKPVLTNSTCDGELLCCKELKDVDGEVLEGILSRLLGIVIPDVNAPVGLGCQPLSDNEAEDDSCKPPAALIISSASAACVWLPPSLVLKDNMTSRIIAADETNPTRHAVVLPISLAALVLYNYARQRLRTLPSLARCPAFHPYVRILFACVLKHSKF